MVGLAQSTNVLTPSKHMHTTWCNVGVYGYVVVVCFVLFCFLLKLLKKKLWRVRLTDVLFFILFFVAVVANF